MRNACHLPRFISEFYSHSVLADGSIVVTSDVKLSECIVDDFQLIVAQTDWVVLVILLISGGGHLKVHWLQRLIICRSRSSQYFLKVSLLFTNDLSSLRDVLLTVLTPNEDKRKIVNILYHLESTSQTQGLWTKSGHWQRFKQPQS